MWFSTSMNNGNLLTNQLSVMCDNGIQGNAFCSKARFLASAIETSAYSQDNAVSLNCDCYKPDINCELSKLLLNLYVSSPCCSQQLRPPEGPVRMIGRYVASLFNVRRIAILRFGDRLRNSPLRGHHTVPR